MVRKICNLKISNRNKFLNGTIAESIKLLSKSERKKILLVIILQIALGFIDLLGIAIVGVLGALAVSGIQSKEPGNRVEYVLELIGIANNNFQTQAAILGLVAAIVLIGRTIFSVIFTKKILFFLSLRGAEISSNLIRKILSQSLLKIQSRSTQETLYSVTEGVKSIVLGVLGALVSLISDSSLLLIMTLGLFIVDPILALSSLLLFSTIAVTLYKIMHLKAKNLGIENSTLSIKSNELIIEVLTSYRESVVRNTRQTYADSIGIYRRKLANSQAELTFMPQISKYVIESSVVVGAILISAIQFILKDASHAVGTLSVFLAAGTRIAPAVLRVQQGALSIRGSLGIANPTLAIIKSLEEVTEFSKIIATTEFTYQTFNPKIQIECVSFSYPGSKTSAVNNVSLNISAGSFVAIVGSSGAGKSTLVDILLGVIAPNTGQVRISGKTPLEAISTWTGAISYVPQDILISDGSIRENIILGYTFDEDVNLQIHEALNLAKLSDFVEKLPKKMETRVGERGVNMSGGQRQRLGIARALFSKPKLLVLDEATSALDGETESDISRAIQSLKGKVTVVMIAHRLSTVRNADVVVYMENGTVRAVGSFNEVRKLVPDFDSQALLMGL